MRTFEECQSELVEDGFQRRNQQPFTKMY